MVKRKEKEYSWQLQGLYLGLTTLIIGSKGLALSPASEGKGVPLAESLFVAETVPTWNERLAEAEDLRNAGEYDSAIVIYQNLLVEQPASLPAREGLALTYAYSEEYESSIALYRQMVSDYPENLQLQQQLAEIYGWQGDYVSAINLYESILEITPDAIVVRLALAETLAWAGDYDNAIAAYDQVIAADPDNQAAWFARPQVAAWADQPERAIALYKATLAKYPDDPVLLLGLARVYQSQQQFRQAIDVLRPLLDSQNTEALAIRDEIRGVRSISEFEADGIGDQESSFSFGQVLRFRINDGYTRQSIRLGYTTFNQSGLSSLENTTLQVGVEGQVNSFLITGTAGVDLFSRLPAVPNLGLKVSTPLATNLTLAGNLEYGAYRENVATLENQITAFRIEPTLYWQIDSSTSLFLSYMTGFYSDGNLEHQASFVVERELGDFFVSALFFYWSFADNPQTGYFAPPNYIIYSGELGWRTNITEQLICQISASIENEIFENTSALSNTYQAGCGLILSPKLAFNLDYQYSTNNFFSSGSDSASQTIRGQMSLLF